MFLDEIGDMSPPLQAKLLQVLQDGEFSRLGGKADVSVDVRVITATNRDLERAVAEGQFREDLYFRLNVVTITMPPLQDRREEIPILTDHFLKKYSAQYNKPSAPVSAELAREFMQYDWPGNVRQLENLIKRMVVLGSETLILNELRRPAAPRPHHAVQPASRPPTPSVPAPAPPEAGLPTAFGAVGTMPVGFSAMPSSAAAAPAAVGAAAGATGATAVLAGAIPLKDIGRAAAREAEREMILRMLARTHWNRKEAAEILGISYKALLYKIKENGLDNAS